MGEDALHVELPEATGEASGSRPPARPVPLYNRIEPLHLPQDRGLDRRRRLLRAARRRNVGPVVEAALLFGDPFQWAQPAPEILEAHPPHLGAPDLPPVRAGQVQGAVEQHGDDLQPRHEDAWVQQLRLAQQQVLAERFAGNNGRNPPPPALPDNPIHPIPRRRGGGAGGARMDPMDRGMVDQWRRGVPNPGGPEDRVAL